MKRSRRFPLTWNRGVFPAAQLTDGTAIGGNPAVLYFDYYYYYYCY